MMKDDQLKPFWAKMLLDGASVNQKVGRNKIKINARYVFRPAKHCVQFTFESKFL